MGLQRCPQVRVLRRVEARLGGCPGTPGDSSAIRPLLSQGLGAGKSFIESTQKQWLTDALPPSPGPRRKGFGRLDRVSAPRSQAHPNPAASPPGARHCCARSFEGPTLQPRGRNGGGGGVPSRAPPRGARPYLGKLCPADSRSHSCFRLRFGTFLRTGWWAARNGNTRGQARCVCPLPRVCTPSTSRPGDLGKQLSCCEPPFLYRWAVKAGDGRGASCLVPSSGAWLETGWVGRRRAGLQWPQPAGL